MPPTNKSSRLCAYEKTSATQLFGATIQHHNATAGDQNRAASHVIDVGDNTEAQMLRKTSPTDAVTSSRDGAFFLCGPRSGSDG